MWILGRAPLELRGHFAANQKHQKQLFRKRVNSFRSIPFNHESSVVHSKILKQSSTRTEVDLELEKIISNQHIIKGKEFYEALWKLYDGGCLKEALLEVLWWKFYDGSSIAEHSIWEIRKLTLIWIQFQISWSLLSKAPVNWWLTER